VKTAFRSIRLVPLAALAAVLAPSAALASTAASTTITNSATVNYNDSGGNAMTPVTATASITVSLVPSSPTLSSPANTTISQGTSATLTYTFTSTANGVDTYNLSSAATPSNLSSVTPTFPGGSSVALGGSTLAADATNGATSITTPYDGTNDSIDNGIAAGDTIVIGSNAYTVSSVTENPGSNTTTIALGSAISGGAVATASIIGERQTFTVSVPSGTVTSGGSGSQSVSTTATSATSSGATTTQGTPTVITVNRPTLSVTKTVSGNDGTSYAASVSAPPSTSLIWKIVVSNSGSSDATSVAVSDVVPSFLTYVSGSGKYATDGSTTYAAATALTEGSGGYSYTSGSRTVAYNPGSPGTGTVAGGGTLVLFFRTTID